MSSYKYCIFEGFELAACQRAWLSGPWTQRRVLDEVPAYRAAATGIDEELDVMLFWRQHRLSLPH